MISSTTLNYDDVMKIVKSCENDHTMFNLYIDIFQLAQKMNATIGVYRLAIEPIDERESSIITDAKKVFRSLIISDEIFRTDDVFDWTIGSESSAEAFCTRDLRWLLHHGIVSVGLICMFAEKISQFMALTFSNRTVSELIDCSRKIFQCVVWAQVHHFSEVLHEADDMINQHIEETDCNSEDLDFIANQFDEKMQCEFQCQYDRILFFTSYWDLEPDHTEYIARRETWAAVREIATDYIKSRVDSEDGVLDLSNVVPEWEYRIDVQWGSGCCGYI